MVIPKLRPLQGFGSAGSSRSLRTTATGAGVWHTATVMALMDTKGLLPARLDEPTIEELWRSIRTQQCCWCLDTRTFRSLSQHWTRGHGLVLQEIRDRLQVQKRYSFISEETKAIMAARGRKLYDPMHLKQKGNPRALSAYGIRIQQEKLLKARDARVLLGQLNIPRECQVCGGTFYHPQGKKLKTCRKPACLFEIRSRAKKGRPTPWSKGNTTPPRDRQCVNCGATFNPRRDFGYSQRRTCSADCKQEGYRARARARTEHIMYIATLAVAARKAVAAQKANARVGCSEEGCKGKYRAKGFCGKHYQRQLKQRDTVVLPPERPVKGSI